MAILQQSTQLVRFLREVIGVIPAVSVYVNQRQVVIAEDTSVAVDAVGEVSKRHIIHLALFRLKGISVSRCEEERRTTLKDARDILNCPNRVLGSQMEHGAPRDRSIERSIGEWAGLNNASNSKRDRAVLLKACKHRTRTI